jgi:HSP20 family molecular chaperone IbpA
VIRRNGQTPSLKRALQIVCFVARLSFPMVAGDLLICMRAPTQKEITTMLQVPIKRADDADKKAPIFEELAKRFEGVRQRAFDLFDKRGRELGHELEDWLKAERELFGRPTAELAEKDGVYEMQIALPGFESRDVEVTATPTEVIVHATTKEEKKTLKATVLWTEFGYNNVSRCFELPNLIAVDKVTVNLENGILRINAPQTAKPKEARVAAA